MNDSIKPYLEHVLGDTWCIVTGFCRIPLYMPDRSQAIMIDSGLKNPDREGILSLLKREKIHVAALLTSHFHPDHIGNHSALVTQFGCTVYMTPYADLVSQESANLLYEVVMPVGRRKQPSWRADRIIPRNTSMIEVAGTQFSLLWLSGHMVEQVGFVTPDGVAYLGDTLLSDHILQAMKLPYYTCLRLDLQAKESLRKLNCKRYILAHNGVYEDIGGLIDRNSSAIYKQLEMIEQLACQWMTFEQLCVTVMTYLGMDLNETRRVVGARRNIRILVEYLVETGRLKARVREGYVEYLAK